MTEYLKPKFSVPLGGQAFSDGWDRIFAKPKRDVNAACGTTKCPRCMSECPCVDHVAVDIGIGIQTGEHTYVCDEHGEFGWYGASGELVFREDGPVKKRVACAKCDGTSHEFPECGGSSPPCPACLGTGYILE